jgi:uncharacterized surface protein with fasciclin (FAS1) repeats
MKRIHSVKVALAMACLLLAASCSDNFNQVALPSGKTIATLATENADLNILVAALTKTGLASTFANNNSGVFTVFAPTDVAFVAYFNSLGGAFATLDEAGVINWINTTLSPTSATLNLAGLTNVLLYHVVNSEIPFSKVTGAQGLVTLSGSARISISKVGSNVVLNANRAVQNSAGNGAQSVTLDVDASNGVIHTIDRVLIPVSVANIWAGTSPAAAPVVNFPGFTVNYAVSPPAVSVFGTVMPRTGSGGSINVATAAVGTLNDYNLLSAAIARAELATTIITIATPFPDFTLFAPTDAAFQAFLATLPNTGTPVTTEATARDFINTLSPTVLADILRYHVVPGRVVSTDLSNGQVVTTALTGGTFTVNIAGSVITLVDKNTGVADPTVTSANNLTNAGVLHRIDGVLRSN